MESPRQPLSPLPAHHYDAEKLLAVLQQDRAPRSSAFDTLTAFGALLLVSAILRACSPQPSFAIETVGGCTYAVATSGNGVGIAPTPAQPSTCSAVPTSEAHYLEDERLPTQGL